MWQHTEKQAAQGDKLRLHLVTAEVRVRHSSEDSMDSKTIKERRLGTCIEVTRKSEGSRDGQGQPRIETRNKIQKLQRALYCKAKAEPKYRFYSLYGELRRKDLIESAMRAVAENDGAAGVDGQQCAVYKGSQEQWDKWRDALIEELSNKRYRASPVRRVYIRKDGSDKLRPLGIPTVKDRVVQKAVAMLLEPIWEADSHPNSFAYRRKRDAKQAMECISKAIRSGKTEVIDADLSGYFDSIPHRELMRLVAKRVSDGSILKLIKAWLRAPIVEIDEQTGRKVTRGSNKKGTPQGGVISPLLANLYLNRLDWQVNEHCEHKPEMVRYADDLVILSKPGIGAELLERTKKWLERAGLTLNEEKTRLLDVQQEKFKFLGFEVSWRTSRQGRGYPHIEPHPRSQQKLRQKVRDTLNHWTLWRSEEQAIKELNATVRGWGNYFYHANSTRVFHKMNQYVAERTRRWLWRKHGCSTAQWATYPESSLRQKFGLYKLPVTAAWCTPKF